MAKGRIVFQGLHQVGCDRILEQHRHRPRGVDRVRGDRLMLTRVADDDLAQALLQILEIFRQAENRHDFGSHGDIESVFTREAVSGPAEGVGDTAQCTVVHIHHAAPGDTA